MTAAQIKALADLREAINKAGGLRTLKFNGTLQIYCGDLAAKFEEGIRKKAIATGHAIEWPDGSREFYEWDEVTDFTKTGADVYTWHKDGQRCLHVLMRKIVDTTGKFTKTEIRRGFRRLES